MPPLMPPQPPGTILQFMYLKERLARLKPGKFVEIGCGQGYISKILLDSGWHGVGYDLNADSLKNAGNLNAQAIADGRYCLKHENWLAENSPELEADLVISSLVLEHMSDSEESEYIRLCQSTLKPGGVAILFVPGSPENWGIDDEIAGHYRRYTAETLSSRFDQKHWQCTHVAGLNYPLSNMLLPLSNKLVRRAEANKLEMTMHDRTVLSSNRQVAFKTSFPALLNLVLNEIVMSPFHIWQKLNINNPSALILYAEFTCNAVNRAVLAGAKNGSANAAK
jgi:SAM-dependent methyltransferase